MKRLSWFNKLVYALNILVALLLLIACAVPYLTYDFFSFLTFLGLVVPFLVVGNFLFFLYWLLQRKRQMLTSLIILVVGYLVLGTFIKPNFGEENNSVGDLKVMSYNVRGFNRLEADRSLNTREKITELVASEKPDIICFQEVGISMKSDFLDYPYSFLDKFYDSNKVHLGVFSKYPIVKAETIQFKNSINNGSYADILYKGDTIRIYNVHMQSLGVTPGSGNVRSKPVEYVYDKVNHRFKRQMNQAKLVQKHKKDSPYPTLLSGDFNNTQFSSTYHLLKGEMKDTFIEKGTGLGRTYDLLFLPFRIDFIFADEHFDIVSHKNYDDKFSDHFPIMSTFNLRH